VGLPRGPTAVVGNHHGDLLPSEGADRLFVKRLGAQRQLRSCPRKPGASTAADQPGPFGRPLSRSCSVESDRAEAGFLVLRIGGSAPRGTLIECRAGTRHYFRSFIAGCRSAANLDPFAGDVFSRIRFVFRLGLCGPACQPPPPSPIEFDIWGWGRKAGKERTAVDGFLPAEPVVIRRI